MTDQQTLTRAEIMHAEPWQLRLWIAEYVMGCRRWGNDGTTYWSRTDEGWDTKYVAWYSGSPEPKFFTSCPNWPENIADAFALRDHIIMDGPRVQMNFVYTLSEAIRVRRGDCSMEQIMLWVQPVDIARAALLATLDAQEESK